MKAIAEQDAKKVKKVFHRRRLKYLANYDTADILNHFKSGKTYKKDMDTQKKVLFKIFMKKILYQESYHIRTNKKKSSCQLVNKSMYLSELWRHHCLVLTSYL